MKLKDQFRFIRQNTKKNKVFMIATGCTFLIVLLIAYGLYTPKIEVEIPQSTKVVGIEVSTENLNDEDITRMEDIEGVRAVTRKKGVRQFCLGIKYTTEGYEGIVSTYSPHFPSVLEAGIELAEGRLPESKYEVIVGDRFPSSLRSPRSPDHNVEDMNEIEAVKGEEWFDEEVLGHTFSLNLFMVNEEEVRNFPVTVVGVLDSGTNSVYITDDLFAEIESFTGTLNDELVNSQDFCEMDTENTLYESVVVYANYVDSMPGVLEELRNMGYVIMYP
ncbi:hypothetical protein [Jeotgalibacillus marinus]|uniref:Uncharacterized protein n=1 Tax=Jeotgalibacillus marinus TaxID=86667 RepID=A0ABV3Q4X3_9BACL